VYGSFSGEQKHELAVAKGKVIEIMQLDSNTNKLHLVYRQEVFGLIRSILPFRLMGMQKDYLVVGSDSGRIVILEFDANGARLIKLH
jgi:splicing factor 3B subunit 3